MKSKVMPWLIGATILGMTGCAGQTPVANVVAPAVQAKQATRTLQSVGTDLSFAALVNQLPQRIELADAERMLVQIDPGKVKVEGTKDGYKLQNWGGFGGRGGRGGGFGGRWRGHGGGGFGGFGFGAGAGLWGAGAGYLGAGNGLMFPYSNVGTHFAPYMWGAQVPYLAAAGCGDYVPAIAAANAVMPVSSLLYGDSPVSLMYGPSINVLPMGTTGLAYGTPLLPATPPIVETIAAPANIPALTVQPQLLQPQAIIDVGCTTVPPLAAPCEVAPVCNSCPAALPISQPPAQAPVDEPASQPVAEPPAAEQPASTETTSTIPSEEAPKQ